VGSSPTGPSNESARPSGGYFHWQSSELEFTTRQKGVEGEDCQWQSARESTLANLFAKMLRRGRQR
jgi:hypothetical protein